MEAWKARIWDAFDLVSFAQLSPRMWQQISAWGLSILQTPPGNPFIATDFTRPSGSSSPRSGLCCVCVACSGNCSSQKIQHTTGHLAELAMTSNLTTNWKTNKSPQDISIKEPEIYVSNKPLNTLSSLSSCSPLTSLSCDTHIHTHTLVCTCVRAHLHTYIPCYSHSLFTSDRFI